MTIEYIVNLKKLNWESPVEGVRFKKSLFNEKSIRIVEYTDNFIEPDWCTKGHIGFVISGEFEIDFNVVIIKYKKGDVITIASGEKHKHKANIKSKRVKVFLVEDNSL